MSYEIKSPLHRAFITNVRDRRTTLGWTMQEAAKKLKIAYGSYAQIEHGRRTPTIEVVERVARILKIDPIELLTEKELATK